MSDAWMIFRVLLRNGMSLDLKSRKGKRGLALILLLAVCFAPTLGMLYMSFLASFQAQTGLDALYLQGGLIIPCVLAAIMGLFVIPTAFYFSRDIAVLLPLPVRGRDIVLAKTGTALLSQVSLGVLFALPVVLAYLTVHPDPLRILAALLILVTIPVLPVMLVGILVMLLMRFVPLLRNKDRFNLVFGLLSLVIALAIGVASGSVSGSGQDYAELLADPAALQMGGIAFFQIEWAARAIVQLSLSDLCLYLGATLLGFAAFELLAQKVYLPAVTSIGGASARSRKKGAEKPRSPFAACMLAENRMLLRTPAWFMNCILSSFIPSVIMIAILFLQDVPSLLRGLDIPSLTEWMLAAGAGSVLFFGATNCIASTAFSREGQNLWRMKVIPVSLEKQILGKGLLGAAWSAAATLPVLALIVWLVNGSALDLFLLAAGTVVGGVFVNGLGLLIDAWHPKLVWDDETMAVKNNFNGMIELFGSWLMVGILALPLLIPAVAAHAALYLDAAVFVLALADLWLVLKGPRAAARFLANQI